VTASEDRSAATAPTPSVVARCEGCGLGYELDLLRLSPGELVDACADCGSPVYVVGPVGWRDQAEAYLLAFGDGWDACAEFMAAVVMGERVGELPADVAAVLEDGS